MQVKCQAHLIRDTDGMLKILEDVRVFKSLIFHKKKKKVNLLLVLIFKQFRGRT